MRILFRLYRAFSSTAYWVRRRFTPAGLAVIAGMICIGGIGIDITQNVGYQAFAFLFCLLAVAMGSALFFRTQIVAERNLPRFGSVGDVLSYPVLIHNKTSHLQRGLMLLETAADPRPGFEEFVAQLKSESSRTKSFRIQNRPKRPSRALAKINSQPIPPLPPRGQAEVKMTLTPLKRGVLRLMGVEIARPDPIGLFYALRHFPLSQSILILPKRYILPPIPLPGSMKYQQGGVAQASSVGESEEFVALRDYRPGDPLRHVHWKSWAKVGKPVVKEFTDEFFVRHALILDTFFDAPESVAFEEAVSVAASFACTVQSQESLLDLLFVGPQAFCFTVGRGLAHTEQMLEILASVQPCRDKPFQSLEHLVLDHVGIVSGCIVILLAWDERRRELVKRLGAMGIPILVLVIVESGQSETVTRALTQDKPERFHVLESGRIAEGLARL